MHFSRVIRLVSLSCLALAGGALAQPPAPAPAKTAAPAASAAKLFDYQDITLDNGLRVVTSEDFSCPVLAVHLWYHVGSKDENPERQGFAHMFEHMMFQGTDRLNNTGHFDNIHRVGGNCNAYTAFDQTVYIQTLPSNQLDLALYLEAERMSFLRIDQKSFDTERKVVEEERRLGLNRPYGTLLEQVLPAIFKTHPYRWSPIGKIPHLRSSEVQELRDFWTTYYVPNNATLVVVGAAKHADVQEAAKKAFGWIPKGANPPRVTVKDPMPEKARSIKLQDPNAPAPLVGQIYRTVPTGHKDTAALEIMASILGGGESSRLYRDLVADKETAMFALGAAIQFEQEGMVAIGAVLSPFSITDNTKKVMRSIDTHLEKIRTEPVSDEELLKGKNQLLSAAVTATQTAASKAGVLGAAAVLQNDLGAVNTRLDEIRAVTKEDIQRVANEYMAPSRVLKITVERNLLGMLMSKKGNAEEDAPVTAKVEETAPAPGRKGVTRPGWVPNEPPRGSLMAFDAKPNFRMEKLPNGLKVVVVTNREIPFVTVQMGLQAGSWAEPKTGVANMALSLLTKGTATRSDAELAKELDTYAISLGGNAGQDSSSVTAACLTEHLDRAVMLLADVTLNPVFPPKEFDKMRKQVRTGLAISANTPEYLAEKELRQRLFGNHPYSRTVTGEAKDLDALKATELAPWWNEFARPDMATLIFAGDIELQTARALAEKYFGAWKAEGGAPKVTVAPIPPAEPTKIYLLDRPGSGQSQIRVGQLSMTRSDPKYSTAVVSGGYFGGAFGSRLNETIRVKKGLTYGASGGFRPQRFAGTFNISTFSKTATTAEAVKAVMEEIERFGSEPPSVEELDKTKSHFLGGFAGERETPQDIAGDVWMMETNNLTPEYFDRIVKGVTGVTADQCTGLVHDVVDPSRMVMVVVGDASQIKKDLEKVAPVEVVKTGPELKMPEAKPDAGKGDEDKDDAEEAEEKKPDAPK